LNRGIKFILLSTLSFALVNIGVKSLSNPAYFGFQKFPAHELVLFRSLISFLISFIWLKHKKLPILGYNRKWLFIRGVFGTAALTIFFFTIQNMDLSIATVLQYLSPIFTLFIGVWLFKDRVTLLQWLMIGIAFMGVFVIGYHKMIDAEKDVQWLFWGLLSAFCSGVAYNAIIKCRETDTSLNVVIYFPMIAIPIMLIWACFEFVMPIGVEWLIIIAIGLVTQAAQVFMTKALHAGKSSEIIPFKYFGAVYAVVIGYLIFDERLQLFSFLGILLVVSGVLGSQLLTSEKRNRIRKALRGK
jgi:drug/metabolite transporter (DMT)-like permease